MAVYSTPTPSSNFRRDQIDPETNKTATGEFGVSSSSGLYITNLTQKQLIGSLVCVKVYGTAHTGIVLIDPTSYTIRSVVAGGLAITTDTGQLITDTSTGNAGTTDNKVNVGWYSDSSSGEKFFAVCNRLDGVSLAAQKIEVSVIG